MIIEDVLAGDRPHYISKKEWERVNEARYRARKFVFTPEASKLIGQFAIESGDLVLQHRQFARAPYPDTYIEIDSRQFYDGRPILYDQRVSTQDHNVGYLITGSRVYGFAHSERGNGITPWFYNIVPPGQMSPWRSIGAGPRVSRRQQLALMLGSTSQTEEAQLFAEQLLEECSLHFCNDNIPGGVNEIDSLFGRVFLNFAGDVRNIWALLLWINQPTRVRIIDAPAIRRLHRGKLRAYAAHHVISIDLGRVKTIRRAYEIDAPRLAPRGHEVKGYWQHHGGDKACSHEWPLVPDEDDIFVCKHCGRKRWWNDETVRGDATRGWVTKEYQMKWEGRWLERQNQKKHDDDINHSD